MMNIDEIARLAELMTAQELTEISIQTEEMKLRLKRGPEPFMPAMLPPAPAPTAAPRNAEAETGADDPPAATGTLITSPIVGTFYQAPAPDAPPFVQIGDKVTPDTVVCIVEAMKVMNEIKAEQSGIIRKVLVENATPVEFGQPLFEIDPV